MGIAFKSFAFTEEMKRRRSLSRRGMVDDRKEHFKNSSIAVADVDAAGWTS